jgi:hypothetical protein
MNSQPLAGTSVLLGTDRSGLRHGRFRDSARSLAVVGSDRQVNGYDMESDRRIDLASADSER